MKSRPPGNFVCCVSAGFYLKKNASGITICIMIESSANERQYESWHKITTPKLVTPLLAITVY